MKRNAKKVVTEVDKEKQKEARVMSVFEDVPDFVVVEEILMKIAMDNSETGEMKMKMIINFGRSCHRFYNLVKSSPRLWCNLDGGAMWECATTRLGSRKAILTVLKSPFLSMCGKFSEVIKPEILSSPPLNIPLSHAIAMLCDMPNLHEITLVLTTEAVDFMRSDLKEYEIGRASCRERV